MRAATNAILYLLRTGSPWRYLPCDGFSPRSTVYNIFRKFQREGVWEAIWAELHMALRERMEREASPRLRFSAADRSNQRKRARQRRCVGLRRRQEGEGPQDPHPRHPARHQAARQDVGF